MNARWSWTRLPAAVAILVASFVVPAHANHAGRTLNVTPETISLPLGVSHTFTARISRVASTTSGTINIDFENEAGVNDTDANTPDTPDLTCSIAADAQECTVSYSGTSPGRDLWRAWIDHDGLNSTTEADLAEGFNDNRDPGTGGTSCPGAGPNGEPDCTDVVDARWGSGTLDCDDAQGPDTEREVNLGEGGSASNETYTCTVRTNLGTPDPSETVNAEVTNGVNDPDDVDGASYDSPDYSCDTSAQGTCTINVTQNENESGTATVCFWVGNAEAGAQECAEEATDEGQAGDGSDLGNDLADQTELTWQARSTVGGGLDVETESASSPLGAQQQATATVYDQFGEPFRGTTTVFFEFFRGAPSDDDRNSPATPDGTCTTADSSSCTFTYEQTSVPGTDLMCAWINEAPEMSGTNNNGSCSFEPLADTDDSSGAADPPEPPSDPVDVVERIWQNSTSATRLDCSPETSSGRRGTVHTLICTAFDSAGASVVGAEIDVEATGTNDPDALDQPSTPDFSCVTTGSGECAITHGHGDLGQTTAVGTTTYRAWIDQDNTNSTTEADATEGRDETSAPGGTAEPDGTDVMERTWMAHRCTISGTGGPDTLIGTPDDDIICGRGGNDRIFGGGGEDALIGHKGSDSITGGEGEDKLYGDKGPDQLNGGPGRDVCEGGEGRDRFSSCEDRNRPL